MADRVFEHFHISLIERLQGDLLEPKRTREEWLRHILRSKFSFEHRSNDFWWVPHPAESDLITATIERQKARSQHRGPEEDAAEFVGQEWQGSLVVIDPRHRPDGQKLAIERDDAVGSPNAVLTSLVASINNRPEHQYQIVMKALFDSEGFWAFAERHGGLVKYVSFDFVVPNMFFGASTSVDTGLRRLGQDTNAQEVKVRLDSENGVQADSKSVRDAMAYAEEGNANVTAQALNGDRYSSTRRRKTSKVSRFRRAGEKLHDWLGQVLGREDDSGVDGADRVGDGPDRR